MTTAVIADAGNLSRAALRRRLSAHCPEISVIGEAKNAVETLSLIGSLRPGLLFLDTDMPSIAGYSLFALTGNRSIELILTTEHEQAFEHVPAGPTWLVKPYGVNALIDCVRTALRKKEAGVAGGAHADAADLSIARRLALPSVNGLQFLDVRDIVYLEANSNYTILYLTSKPSVLVSKSLKEFEGLLPQAFIRIHHSWIVNKNLVAKYIRGEGGQVQMKNGTLLTVARRKKEDFLREMALG